MMEDLTLLLPPKVKVKTGEKAIISCPACGRKHSVLPAVIKRYALKDYELKCKCKEPFQVRFEVNKCCSQDFDLAVINPQNGHTFKNINIQLLSENHIQFTCKEQHSLRKGQKLRITFSFPTSTPPPILTNAIVKLVLGNFVSCFFPNTLNLP